MIEAEGRSSLVAPRAVAVARARAWRVPRGSGPVRLLVIAVLAYLVVPPLVIMVWTGFSAGASLTESTALSVHAYRVVVTDPQFPRLVVNTVVFAVASSVCAIVLGGAMAWLVARTNAAGKRLAYAIAFIGFAFPGMLWVIGWVLLLGPSNGLLNQLGRGVFGAGFRVNVESMPGLVLVEALLWVPMVFFLLVGPLSAMDPGLEEAGSMCGAGRLQVLRKVTLPLLRPSLYSVLLLMLIRSLQAFEVPLFIGTPGGIRVISSQIFLNLRESYAPDYSSAAAYSSMLLVLLAAMLLAYSRMTRAASRFQTVTGKGFRVRPYDLGRFRWLAGAFFVLLLAVYLLPAAVMVLSGFRNRLDSTGVRMFTDLSWRSFRRLGGFPGLGHSVVNSIEVALATSAIVIVLACAGAWLVTRTGAGANWAVEQLFGLPLIIPGIVLGLGFLLFYLYVPIPLYGTLWIIILAYVAAFAMYGMRYLQPALIQIGAELEEAAVVGGARWWAVWRRVLLPMLAPALLGAFLFVFFHSFRELSVASLLYNGQTSVVSTQLLDMWTNGDLGVLSAFGSVVTVVSIGLGGLVYLLGRRWISVVHE